MQPYQFDWSVIWESRDLLLSGLRTTLLLAGLIFVVSFAVGAAVGAVRALVPGWPARLCGAYVEAFRNVPPLVILFFVYFGLQTSVWIAAVVGLGLAMGAEVSESVRSGINSIPRAQREAASASGLGSWQLTRYVVGPQAALIVLPVLGINALSVLKNSAIAVTLGIEDLTFVTQDINNRTFHGLEAATATTVAYLLLSLVIVAITTGLERSLKVSLRTAH
jgi:His/Glu/Gln/Arg/opine family amino acid ABC transporter permease subunit